MDNRTTLVLRTKRLAFLFLMLLGGVSMSAAMLLFVSTQVYASDPADMFIEIQGGNNSALLALDANSFCGNTVGPDGMWLPVEFTNNSGTDTMTGLEITFEPPEGTVADDNVRYIGDLGPGKSVVHFFFIDYSGLRSGFPASSNGGICAEGTGNYVEPYTITVDSLGGADPLSSPVQFTSLYTNARALEANAAGLVGTETFGPGAAVGQLFSHTVTYTFGNNVDIFFQPTGNGSFLDVCWRLVGSEVVAISGSATGINVGDKNVLHFPGGSTAGSGATITVEYMWTPLCTQSSTTIPYATAQSGSDLKYRSDNFIPPFTNLPTPTLALSLTKGFILPPSFTYGVDDPLVVTYVVTISNSTAFPVVLSNIYDSLEAEPGNTHTFIDETMDSDVDSANSSISPALSDSGVITWAHIPVTMSYVVPGNSAIVLKYTANLDYDSSIPPTVEQQFTNTVTAKYGNVIIGPDAVRINVSQTPTAITLKSITSRGVAGQPLVVWISTLVLLSAMAIIAFMAFRMIRQPDRRDGKEIGL
jgi:hypothetical protein